MGSPSILNIPLEVRNLIYSYYFVDTTTKITILYGNDDMPTSDSEDYPQLMHDGAEHGKIELCLLRRQEENHYDGRGAYLYVYSTKSALPQSCRQIYRECITVYRSSNVVEYLQYGDPSNSAYDMFAVFSNQSQQFLQNIRHLQFDAELFICGVLALDEDFSNSSDYEVYQKYCENGAYLHLGELTDFVFPNLLSMTLYCIPPGLKSWLIPIRNRAATPSEIQDTLGRDDKSDALWQSDPSSSDDTDYRPGDAIRLQHSIKAATIVRVLRRAQSDHFPAAKLVLKFMLPHWIPRRDTGHQSKSEGQLNSLPNKPFNFVRSLGYRTTGEQLFAYEFNQIGGKVTLEKSTTRQASLTYDCFDNSRILEEILTT